MKNYLRTGFYLIIVVFMSLGFVTCGNGLFTPDGEIFTWADHEALVGGGSGFTSNPGNLWPNSCCDEGDDTETCSSGVVCTCNSGDFNYTCIIEDCCEEGQDVIDCEDDGSGCSCTDGESVIDCTF